MFRNLLLINFLCFYFVHNVVAISKHPILIVVSYDAFRYDFFDKGLTPNMEKLRKEGTFTKYIENVFPTKTFPNHHSIATGVYPEYHGVVDNAFYDPKLKRVVKMSPEMYGYSNNEVVPIWIANERFDDDRHSGVMMWPGGLYPYKNTTPTYSKAWDLNYDWYKRVDDVFNWILDPKKPANLIMLYIAEPDTHAHVFGPDSSQVEDFIKKLDNITAYIEKKIVENKLKDKVNVVHLSDHGMLSVQQRDIFDLTKFLTNGTYEMIGTSPILHIIPKEGHEAEIYDKLKNAAKQHGHFDVYRRSETLERWHYKENTRIGPIIAVAKIGFAFQDLYESIKFYEKQYHFKVTSDSKFGVHGYDYNIHAMRPFFMARGPRILSKNEIEPFHSLDLMNVFCEILEIRTPNINNGSTKAKWNIVTPYLSFPVRATLTIVSSIIVMLIIIIVCAVTVTLITIKRQQRITTTHALNKRFQQTVNHSNIEVQHLLDAEDA